MSEEKTDNILDDVDEEVQEIDPKDDPNKKNDKPTLDETVQKLIGKAGNHMESTLIGWISKNSKRILDPTLKYKCIEVFKYSSIQVFKYLIPFSSNF